MKLRSLNVLLGIGIFAISAPATVEAGKLEVHPGESIQAAVDLAAPGTKIIVYPGTYTEDNGGIGAVTVRKDGISLMGKVDKKGGEAGKVRLVYDPNHPYWPDPNKPVGNQSGIWAQPPIGVEWLEGFRVSGFTVEGFPGNGIVTYAVDGFKIMKNESINNLVNGIWPVFSANGMVKSNTSYGSLDTALWVEGSENVKVLKNELAEAPTGLEITVSKNVKAMKNDIHDNATGVGLYHPNAASVGNPYGDEMGNWTIKKNHIYNNNGVVDPNDPNGPLVNPAPPGSFSADLPIGGGILIFGTDKAVIKSNLIENNDFYGIAVIDYCTAVSVGPPNRACKDPSDPNSPGAPLLYDPVADDNLFQGNELNHNATNPPAHPLALFTSEIIFVQGLLVDLPHPPEGNCFKKNEIVDPNSPSPVFNFPGDPDTLPTDGC
jgi:hypothetical protein